MHVFESDGWRAATQEIDSGPIKEVKHFAEVSNSLTQIRTRENSFSVIVP